MADRNNAKAGGSASRRNEPEAPAFLDVSRYAADQAVAAGVAGAELPYVPPGKIEPWHSEILKQRKVKSYDISCDVHVVLSNSYAAAAAGVGQRDVREPRWVRRRGKCRSLRTSTTAGVAGVGREVYRGGKKRGDLSVSVLCRII